MNNLLNCHLRKSTSLLSRNTSRKENSNIWVRIRDKADLLCQINKKIELIKVINSLQLASLLSLNNQTQTQEIDDKIMTGNINLATINQQKLILKLDSEFQAKVK